MDIIYTHLNIYMYICTYILYVYVGFPNHSILKAGKDHGDLICSTVLFSMRKLA